MYIDYLHILYSRNRFIELNNIHLMVKGNFIFTLGVEVAN